MNKILATLIGLIFLIGGSSIFIFIKYENITSLRNQITSVSTTEGYYIQLDNSINKIIEIGKINKAHKKWIKKFIIKEIPKDNFSMSYTLLLKKLRSKNIQLLRVQQDEMEVNFLKIKEAATARKTTVNEAIKEYSMVKNDFINSKIEKHLIGERLNTSDIKYY